MKELIISVLLTLFLGPGVGHLYLRQFKKAWILIGLTVVSALLFVAHMFKGLKPEQIMAIQANPAAFARSLTTGKTGPGLVFDIFFAAIWAYALVDSYIIFRHKKASPPPEGQNSHTI